MIKPLIKLARKGMASRATGPGTPVLQTNPNLIPPAAQTRHPIAVSQKTTKAVPLQVHTSASAATRSSPDGELTYTTNKFAAAKPLT